MKKSLLILILTAIITLPAMAELTVEDTVSNDYLKNHGYSPALINAAQKNISQIAGEPKTEPVEKEYYNQPLVNFGRKIMMYIDPSLDDHSFMNDHEIHTTPHFEDL